MDTKKPMPFKPGKGKKPMPFKPGKGKKLPPKGY